MTIATWTPARVEELRNSVEAGLSCSQIAAQIGVTRNAVIGKIHRLGLSPVRPPGASTRYCPPRARHQRAARRPRLLQLLLADSARGAEHSAPTDVGSASPCALLELAKGKCRWPLNDPATSCGAADFMFCGNEAIEGFSYCAGHARLAYRSSARPRIRPSEHVAA